MNREPGTLNHALLSYDFTFDLPKLTDITVCWFIRPREVQFGNEIYYRCWSVLPILLEIASFAPYRTGLDLAVYHRFILLTADACAIGVFCAPTGTESEQMAKPSAIDY